MGGSGCCGCSRYELKGSVNLSLISEGKRILFVNGKYDVNNFDKKSSLVDWISGGSNIGANGTSLIGRKTLCEQEETLRSYMDEDFSNLEYTMKVDVRRASGLK